MLQKKRHNRKKKSHPIFFRKIFFFVFLPLLLIVGSFVWYQSRAVPDLGDEQQVVALPVDVSHVLGTTVGLSATPNISLRIPIFMYHYIENSPSDPGIQKLNIPPSILTSQIETLKNAGYTFILPEDLTAALSGKKKLPEKVAMLSFDDGHMDVYTEVLPILQKEQVKAVVYIIPNYLNRPDYLFTFQLDALAKSSLIEIGAHTMNHPTLAGMNTKEAIYEIAGSRKFLQDLLHIPVNSFAYPYGSFDLATIQLVKDAGFSSAVSVIPGIVQTPENIFFLNRLRPGYRTGQALLSYLKQDSFQQW